MNVLQPLMNEKEIQTDDENIHNQLVNLINSMLFNQRWLNKNRKVRDADSWVSSCRATTASDMVMTKHTTFTENIIYRLRGLKSLPILHDNMYTKAFGPNYDQMTDDELRDAFIKWNQEIIDYVPKDRLLIFDPKDGWTPLCEFLNIPIPENVPFPHLNKRVDLRNRLLKYRFLAQFLNFSLMISFLCYGLDWSSKLRYIEAYKDEDRRDENIWPEHSSHLRTFPKLKCHGMSPEWSIYTNGYATGKKCLFDGIHQRSVYCTSEYILRDGFTHKRRRDTIEQHNSIFKSMKPGDKSYGSVEYSPNFYKINSSVPKVRFGIQSTEHEYNQDLKLLLKELRELDGWKPAPTLTETISSVKFSRK
ncbi:putative nad dependent epimerase/dehydratase [Schistosoma mansoni]|uniref:putative nad dependent epimerase/dehydratase n=1 Tax=Schistosoma mansoni TaxID=6183 RepID=UPI00019B3875|nr:putative nad dependent epimerase/dehydratase [Schistosoma mansoni]|eukprot:XP_018648960.1 putative nad dependent epimerase/dehydratase [Schistosoma mansoni]